MTIFLFSNVLVSGITLFGDLNMKSRRVRFISALSLCVGVGVTIWPFAFQDMRGSSYTAAFWECGDCSETMKGVRNGVSIFLSTGYCIGSVLAILLNAILPEDPDESTVEGEVHWSAIGAKSIGDTDKPVLNDIAEVAKDEEDGGEAPKAETSSDEEVAIVDQKEEAAVTDA